MLEEVMGNKIGILLILEETNVDATFPLSRFILEGLTPPYRPDIMEHGGGLMLFVRVEIPSKLLPNVNLYGKIENIFVKINLRLAKKDYFRLL